MIQIVFFSDQSLLSRLIRWATNSSVSHVAVVTMLHGVEVGIHATAKGVRVDRLLQIARNSDVVIRYAARKSDLGFRVSRAIRMLGAKYDYAGLFGYGVVLFCRRMGQVIKNPFASRRAVVCSELITEMLFDLPDAHALRSLGAEQVTPQDLLQYIESSEFFCEVT